MKTLYILSLLFLWLVSSSQMSALPINSLRFEKICLAESKLFGLDEKGRFHIWNLKTLEKEYISKNNNEKYFSITTNRFNEIYLGTDKGRILKLNLNDYSTSVHLKLDYNFSVQEIFFNSKNEIFLIIPSGVYDPIKKEFWNNFKHKPNGIIVERDFLYFFKKKTNRYFLIPQYTFIDSQDRIWMANSFGEFGGSVQVFDTRERKEILANIKNINFGLLFPKSIFEDNKQNIYITSGLQHFINSGEIYQIAGSVASIIYENSGLRDSTEIKSIENGLFVGPGTYNALENKIYFATSVGFYRSSITDEGSIKNPELLFTPNLLLEREPLAIGAGMAVKKLDFSKDNQLVFLTSNNGIGVYSENKLIMLK